jgi:site-specific DNA-methyltransferase (adenine-specific)
MLSKPYIKRLFLPKPVRVGDCELYLGDCRAVLPLLRGAAAAVVTDPPYGIGYLSRFVAKQRRIAEDDAAPLDTVAPMVATIRDGGAMYLCTRWDVMESWRQAMVAAGLIMKTTIVWDKGNHGVGDLTGDYGSRVELILFAHKGRHALRRGRDVNMMSIKRPPATVGGHPTPKPVDLMERFILNSTDPGDLVIDPFMGSGTTGVACARSGRRFVGCDREPDWHAMTVRRIEEAYEELGTETPLTAVAVDDGVRLGDAVLSRADAARLAEELRRASR